MDFRKQTKPNVVRVKPKKLGEFPTNEKSQASHLGGVQAVPSMRQRETLHLPVREPQK